MQIGLIIRRKVYDLKNYLNKMHGLSLAQMSIK